MKPASFWSLRAIVLSGIILASAAFAFAQGTPLPAQTPIVPLTSGPRPQAPLIPPVAPCTPSGKTALEQLQSGSTMSDVIQQENRVVSCKVEPAGVEVSAS